MGFNRASMNILIFLKNNKDRWWALPLILPSHLVAVASVVNTFTQLGDGLAALYYLPLFFLLAMMLFFGLAAIPGLFWRCFSATTLRSGCLKPAQVFAFYRPAGAQLGRLSRVCSQT
jgi:hypothetical protein